MRVVSLVLAVVLLCAVAFDCSSGVDTPSAQAASDCHGSDNCCSAPAESSPANPTHEHEHEHEHDAPCSPFCTCDCCVVHAMLYTAHLPAYIAYTYSLPRVQMPVAAVRQADSSVWHPPQI